MFVSSTIPVFLIFLPNKTQLVKFSTCIKKCNSQIQCSICVLTAPTTFTQISLNCIFHFITKLLDNSNFILQISVNNVSCALKYMNRVIDLRRPPINHSLFVYFFADSIPLRISVWLFPSWTSPCRWHVSFGLELLGYFEIKWWLPNQF